MVTNFKINQIYVGLKIVQNNEPCIIVENKFVNPGKGQSFHRVVLRKLISRKLLEKTFKSSDIVEIANVIEKNYIFIYNDNNFCYFMEKNNFEQLEVNIKIVGNNTKWLVNQTNCLLTLWDDKPIVVTLPNFIDILVIDTSEITNKYTITYSEKTATLITGAKIKVPFFIKKKDIVKVNTRSGRYISRVR